MLRRGYLDNDDAAYLVPHPQHVAGSAVAVADLSHWEDAVAALKLYAAHAVATGDLTVAGHTKIADILQYLDASLLGTGLRRLDMRHCGSRGVPTLLLETRQQLLGCFRSFGQLHSLNLAHNPEVRFTPRVVSCPVPTHSTRAVSLVFLVRGCSWSTTRVWRCWPAHCRPSRASTSPAACCSPTRPSQVTPPPP